MAAMLRSKVLRILPQISRISSRSVYQTLQTNTVICEKSKSLVHVARSLSTNPLGVRQDFQPAQQDQRDDAALPGLQRRHRLRSQTQDDLQSRLRTLDDQVQRTGRMTEKRFLSVFNEVCRSESVTPNQALLLIRSCGNLLAELSFAKRNELVTNVWDKLAELGVRYDVTHYNALLWVHLQNEHLFSPTDFLAQMESKGIEPNRVTYQRLISVYCRRGDIQGATLILEVLKSKDLPVTEGVFNSLIMGNARAGDMDSAKNMLPVMRNMGLDPSLDTYTALACAYAEKGDIENINQVMEEAISNDFTLTAPFFFKIVNSLATNGHKEHVNQFLDKVELDSFIPDAINLSLNLWTQGHYEESFAVVKTFTTLRANAEHKGTSQCSFFIDHMMNSEHKPSPEVILSYLEQIESIGLHRTPYLKALKQSLQEPGFNHDLAISLMKNVKEQGDIPVRAHYFWPLMAKEKMKGNAQGVLDLIVTMSGMGVDIDIATYREYLLPTLQGDIKAILQQLQDAGIAADLPLYFALSKHLLQERKPNALAKVCQIYEENPTLADMRHLDRTIADNFIRDGKRNVGSLVKLLKCIYDNTGSLQDAESTIQMAGAMDEENRDGDQSMYDNWTDDPKERLGSFLFTLVFKIRQGEEAMRMRQYLERLVEGLAKEGVYTSVGQIRGIRNLVNGRLRMRNMNKSLYKLLDQEEVMADPVRNVDVLTSEQIGSALTQLESSFAEGDNGKNILVKLLEFHAAQMNVEKVEEVLKSYEEQGYEKSGIVYRELILLRCRTGKLDEALKLKNEFMQQYDTITDSTMYKEIITLLIKSQRMEEAFEILQELGSSQIRAYFIEELVVLKVLEDLADSGMGKEASEVLSRCVDQGIVQISRRLVQPLLSVHLQKDDLQSAVEAAREINNQYKLYPNDHDLLVKIVEKGDTKLLQQAMQNMGDIMGEVNMIFSLAFAFLENGKYEEAEKLFKAPGIDAKTARLEWYANRCLENGMDKQLEKLVELTSSVYGCDRDSMYFNLLKLHGGKNNDPDKCLEVYHKIQDEDLIPSNRTLRYIARNLESHNRPVPFTVPVEELDVEPARPRQEPEPKKERPMRPKLNLDASMSPLEQVRLIMKHSHEYGVDLSKMILQQVRRCVDDGESLETFAAVKKECERFHDVTNTIVFRSQELRAHVNNGDLEGAHRIYSQMLQDDKRPPPLIVQYLGRKFADAGRLDDILEMKKEYEAVIRKTDYPDNSSILGAYVTRNDISGAIEYIKNRAAEDVQIPQLGLRYFFNKMVEKDLPLDSVNEMIEDHMKKGEPRPARYLVYAYMSNGRIEQAKELIQSQNLQGCLLTYTIQLSYRNSPPLDQIQRVLELSDVEGTDRTIVYRYLLDGYVKHGDSEGALRVRANMATENLTLRDLDLKKLALLLREKQQPVPFDEPQESLSFYLDQFKNERAELKRISEEADS